MFIPLCVLTLYLLLFLQIYFSLLHLLIVSIWDSNYIYVNLFGIFPQVMKVLFIIFKISSIQFRLTISVGLPLVSFALIQVVSNLLLSPSSLLIILFSFRISIWFFLMISISLLWFPIYFFKFSNMLILAALNVKSYLLILTPLSLHLKWLINLINIFLINIFFLLILVGSHFPASSPVW